MEKMIYAILLLKGNPENLDALLVGMRGISGMELRSVPYLELTAVVTDIKKDNFVTNKSNAIEYAAVIETLVQEFTLLPMRFGSVLESTNAVKMMLERNYDEIGDNLLKVANKLEFGLKVFCDSENLKSALYERSEARIITTENVSMEKKNSVFRDYINKKLQEHKYEELLLTYVNSVIDTIKTQLERLKVVIKFKKMTEAAIIDALFLLEKNKKAELIHLVDGLRKSYPGLNFVLTGPWPPYNFVETAIK